jgi:16S rRNA (uracil1498-N3)-methyltransferase
LVKKEIVEELEVPGGKVRLFVEAQLAEGASIRLTSEQSHYLIRVMRAGLGDHVRVFNGCDGEWRAKIAEVGRRDGTLLCESKFAEQFEVPDIWLAFAPIKRVPLDYIAQKATELGVRALLPVKTHRTIVGRVNLERLRANAIEAAEQSERLTIPEIRETVDLKALLAKWPRERRLIHCDEHGDALPLPDALAAAETATASWGVLTGPEGGFDDSERALIRACPFVLPVTLGPRVMRADTAALAALAILQALRGDWHQPRA